MRVLYNRFVHQLFTSWEIQTTGCRHGNHDTQNTNEHTSCCVVSIKMAFWANDKYSREAFYVYRIGTTKAISFYSKSLEVTLIFHTASFFQKIIVWIIINHLYGYWRHLIFKKKTSVIFQPQQICKGWSDWLIFCQLKSGWLNERVRGHLTRYSLV